MPHAELPAIEADRAQLDMPVTAVYTKADGVVAWQTCIQEAGIGARTSRSPAATAAWATTRRPCGSSPTAWPSRPGQWAPFTPPAFARHLYPTPGTGRVAA